MLSDLELEYITSILRSWLGYIPGEGGMGTGLIQKKRIPIKYLT